MTDTKKAEYRDQQMQKVEDQVKQAEDKFCERDAEIENIRGQVASSRQYVGEYITRLKGFCLEIGRKENELHELQKKQNELLDKIELCSNDQELSDAFVFGQKNVIRQ